MPAADPATTLDNYNDELFIVAALRLTKRSTMKDRTAAANKVKLTEA